jgi:release factor glutamine methyltransferase
MNITIDQVLQEAIRGLEQDNVPEARATAEVLLADVLHTPRWHLYVVATQTLTPEQYTLYRAYLHRRRQGEPVQYITGKQEFWSQEFHVNSQVLIPRPESELLVEHGARMAHQWHACHTQLPLYVIDIGTGSGNIAISLARMLPQAHVWGIDVALGALQVAQDNARRLGVDERVGWICGNLLDSWKHPGHRVALCVANLPYVTLAEWEDLPREIKEHEPRHALVGGVDGLESIRRLIRMSPAVLAPGGTLLLEVGWQQAADVVMILRQDVCFQTTGTYQDLAGIARVVWATRSNE